jgi:hypothetical protein
MVEADHSRKATGYQRSGRPGGAIIGNASPMIKEAGE